MFAANPEHSSMDAFSEILSGVKLKGAVFFRAEFSAPWQISAPESSKIAPTLSPGAPHLIVYHLLLEGRAKVRLNKGGTLSMEAGEVVIFPHGDAHQMGSGMGAPDVEISAIIQKFIRHDLTPMKAGGRGEVARFICGYMAFDPLLSKPILEGLPKIFKVSLRTDRSGQWLENSILHLVEETASGLAGSEAMLSKLSEALFVDTLRRYIDSLPELESGWIAAARDPIVGKCLAILHSRVDFPWTLAELAKEVGLSRTTLLERFNRYLSEPPITYLMRWRLQLAARMLNTTPRGIADISADVGYESEAAFNRAFKREFGLPPARYRNERKVSPTPLRISAG
jgi:AraC-like DNA-binding protein